MSPTKVIGQERKLRDGESTPLSTLPSRHTVKPSNPQYDAHVLAHIKSRIEIDANGCWLWQGFVQPLKMTKHGFRIGGYGSVGYRAKNTAVHRVVWMILKGAVPPKMDVCHTCDVRHCCNPDHLWLGTRRQNLQDMADKGRGLCGSKASQTTCVHGHPLSGDNIYWTNNGRRRHCRSCDRRRLRLKAGWPEDLANTLPAQPLGHRPFPSYEGKQPWEAK